ncbi:MAG TPA: hypothetical protein VKB48_02405 [Candidatus Acidoferrum sp.]|nr:hypothetical protein [Candidatus Acidoferrum sp.]
MVFAVGQRILSSFCGMGILASPALMFAGLALLLLGCALRVISEQLFTSSSLPFAEISYVQEGIKRNLLARLVTG